MAGYNEIKGLRVKYLSADPAGAEDGQVWYNSTTGNLRLQGIGVGAWSSGSPLNEKRRSLGGIGTTTAGLVYGGVDDDGADTVLNSTEEYNGSGWSTGGNLGTARNNGAPAGTQTAGLASGGVTDTIYVAVTEEYNGTSWSEQTDMSTARTSAGGFGIQTAAVVAGGQLPPGSKSDATEEYNGSAWTGGGTMGTGRSTSGFGLEAAGAVCGGNEPALSDKTEEYNGTSWTSSGVLPAARNSNGTSGVQTSALTFAGNSPGLVATTLDYNGSTWSVNPATLSTARQGGSTGPTGTSSSAFYAGGLTPPVTAATEEYNFSSSTVTAGAWASGGNYPTGMNQLGGSGTQTAGLGFGGNTTGGNPNGSNITAEYNGSSWTSGGNLATAKDTASRSGVGTQTATMCINFRNDGTATPSFPIPPANHNYRALTEVEEYNGSSWTAGTATPDGEVEAGTCGTISAALRFGGNPGNPPGSQGSNGTLYWNDSSWTSLNNMSTGRYGLAPAFQGTYNAALGFGGNADPAGSPRVSVTEEFDGTNWTAGGNLNATVFRGSGSGTQTAALSFGGSPNITATEGYDGTAWSTRPSLANGRSFGGGAGSSTAALYIAGDEGIHVEEFTGETTTVNPANNLSVS